MHLVSTMELVSLKPLKHSGIELQGLTDQPLDSRPSVVHYSSSAWTSFSSSSAHESTTEKTIGLALVFVFSISQKASREEAPVGYCLSH